MFKPTVISIDYETALTDGTPSTEYYRDDFRAVSMALSWRDVEGKLTNRYVEGEASIRKELELISKHNIPVVAHNIGFEYGVTAHRFPDLDIQWHADTMRLAQVADGGAAKALSEFEQEMVDAGILTAPNNKGFGLQPTVARWLPTQYHNHKEPFYKYLRETHGIAPRKEGANLHLLPPDMFQQYNTADSDVTLLLYETFVDKFLSEGYDWVPDHTLYVYITKKIVQSRSHGIIVSQEGLKGYLSALDKEIAEIWETFQTRFKTQISALENENLEKYVMAAKTEKGQASRRERALTNPEIYKFNLNSTKQKARLFIDLLGIKPKFTTAKGAPAFGKAFLRQWGEGGEIILNRGSRVIVQTQAKTLLEMSEPDGRYHVDLKTVGTATGRFAGAGGLNIQGLSRKDKGLMSSLIPDPGNVFVSVDLSAGEPTVTTHFSQDPYYRAATFDMVGKVPYYDHKDVLMIDDIYLMGMSRSPMGKHQMKDIFNSTFRGVPFTDQWMLDSEVVKSEIKKERAFHKILILGLGYSMGPKHMVESAFKAGHSLSLKNAREFFKEYWSLFAEVKRLGDRLQLKYKKDGFLINPFGFRLTPSPEYKCLNYFIQSSVSGIINYLSMLFFERCKYAKFTTIIHDEIIFQVPIDKLDEAKADMDAAVKDLNDSLGWSVNIRCGWAVGKTLYEAK